MTPIYFSRICSYHGCQYICKTCDCKFKKNIQCQAVYNSLELFEFPEGRKILFTKIVIMPKGQFSKIKGAVCNVPLEADIMCNILTRETDSNGLILMKL